MSLDESVTVWGDGLRRGDEASAQQLWERYFSQLVRLARMKLPRGVRRDFDEEDVALSAFHSLCDGVQSGKFPRLDDRDRSMRIGTHFCSPTWSSGTGIISSAKKRWPIMATRTARPFKNRRPECVCSPTTSKLIWSE